MSFTVHVILVASVLIGEAGGEHNPVRAMQAVREVIHNRAIAQNEPEWKIVLAKHQFSCVDYEQPYKLVEKAQHHPLWFKALQMAEVPPATDWTHGADHYYAPKLCPMPYWAKGLKPCAVVGGHQFYRLLKVKKHTSKRK